MLMPKRIWSRISAIKRTNPQIERGFTGKDQPLQSMVPDLFSGAAIDPPPLGLMWPEPIWCKLDAGAQFFLRHYRFWAARKLYG